MKGRAPRICLIAPGHVSSTPRLVKNADALAAAGYDVQVVAARSFPAADALDQAIFANAAWRHTVIDQLQSGVLLRSLARRVARILVRARPFATARIAARAHSAGVLRLAEAAAACPADLYLGHCLAGLPAAAFAARKRGAACGFDAEDFHDAETTEAMADVSERTARHVLQKSLLPGCSHFSAASPLIARQYQLSYGIEPVTVLNVFPRTQSPASPIDPAPITEKRPARFYWFSQTIGPGRGLESIVAALGQMRTPVELHLRGFPATGFTEHLQGIAARAKLSRPIQFLSPTPASEMARLAAAADLGLSLEENLPPNRDICLTNKIFIYLLAGIPQLLSPTTAQSAFARKLGAAAIVGPTAEPARLAGQLDAFLANPQNIAVARRTAWELAQSRYCWEVEKEIVLHAVEKIVGPPA